MSQSGAEIKKKLKMSVFTARQIKKSVKWSNLRNLTVKIMKKK
jgi:hypothetical protein